MRTLWSAVSFLAVVNLLALAIFAGWLWRTQRLDLDRLHAVRDLLSVPVPVEESMADAVTREADLTRSAQEAAEALERPPLDSDGMIRVVSLIEEEAAHAARRLEEEQTQLQLRLEQELADLRDAQSEFDARVLEWETATQEERGRKSDEQFLQVVALYEALPPKQAKQMFLELVAVDGMEQAVTYLDAMDPRAAAKIVRELKTNPEVTLATKLLEALGTLGLPADAEDDGDAPNAPEPAL